MATSAEGVTNIPTGPLVETLVDEPVVRAKLLAPGASETVASTEPVAMMVPSA